MTLVDDIYVQSATWRGERGIQEPDWPCGIRGIIRARPTVRHAKRAEAEAWYELAEGFLLDPGVSWLTPLPALQRADNRFYQLRVAAELGVDFPSTTVVWSPDQVRGLGEVVVVKALGSGVIVDPGGRTRVLYATPMTLRQLTAEMLRRAPVILQELLEVEHHLRVITVDRSVWCALLRQTGPTLDWREWSHAERAWEVVPVPTPVREFALRLVGVMGVGYSSQDWVFAKNRYWFLDLNPNGNWLFLPKEVANAVTEAMANWLTTY